jgi:lysozyme family protein
MDHPFTALKPEYTQLLSLMTVHPNRQKEIDEVATKILGFRSRFEQVEKEDGVPIVFAGPSFYREADLNFRLSPAQGDPWNRVSVNVPRGEGPYASWVASAIAAYRGEGLDKIGRANWTWELLCYYGELFNGFGYRDYHRMHTPYLWGGTNIQSIGKYTADGKFDPAHMDEQLGIVPIAKRLVEIAPELALTSTPVVIPPPQPTVLAKSPNPDHNVEWLQKALNEMGFGIDVDGNYGRQTKRAVAMFERSFGLVQDGGYAGPEVLAALEKAKSNG